MLIANGLEVKLPHFNIVWMGEAPDNKLCVASDDGRIRIVGLTAPGRNEPLPISSSKDAINSVVFLNGYIGASSRSEVCIVDTRKEPMRNAVLDGGAYGLTALGSGRVVAACGKNGLLLLNLNEGGTLKTQISRSATHTYEYYKAIELGSNGTVDLIAAATREDGILTQVLSNVAGTTHSRSITFPGVDIVDVVSPRVPTSPLAVVAVSVDGAIHFVQDSVRDTNPLTVTFPGIQGVTYRVGWIRDEIVMLTSYALYRFPGLGGKLLKGEEIKGKIPTIMMPIDAIDIAILYDRFLAIVMPDHTVVFDHALLRKQEDRPHREEQRAKRFDAIMATPPWRERTNKKFLLEPV